ncbi:hypothetical protein AJ79_08698 [Helicocarpus griseus UAMH5409]|uniref:HORMA domain-containing protein n=1 Tax=Helicocarpus griseus UAMH5409 TaxID=1447875 RepID=A0A2B7WQZ2_9EURO|nr:hypothetical protein AJ79_08698 [Helicocarpus griseus UAMH5409]
MARVIFTGVAQKTSGTRTMSKTTPRTTAVQASAQKEKQKQSLGIRQDQSLALVQIMLHASFGTLFYLREFLPLNCFDERDLAKISKPDSLISYTNFVEGKTGSNNATSDTNLQDRRAQPLKIILRGKNPKADKLLDLLEHGIFDALEKNYLEAVQMTVFVDKSKSSQVLESYTFTFKYTGGPKDVGNRLASISLESTGCKAEMKTLKSARRGLEMIVRRLITLSAFLPVLPSERYMEIHLFYTKNSPPGYEPPGFKAAEHNDLFFAQNEMWSRETQSCGAMETGIHSVGLKITSLKCSGEEYPSSEYAPEIPAYIEYGDRVRRAEEIGISQADTIQELGQSSQESSQLSTQTRQDEALKKGLQKMLPLATSTPDSDLIPTQCNADFNAGPKTQLSQLKISELASRKRLFSSPSPGRYTQEREVPHYNKAGAIRCECGTNTESGDMIKCAFCNTRQHAVCYGFVHGQDPAIPDTHACYKCLLEPQEKHLLEDMRTLVLLRRALRVIIEEGYPNRVRDFAQKLNCNGQTIVQITDLLRKQGLLDATPGSKSKGFLEKGLPKFTLSKAPSIREKLRNEIFNPLAKIAHHYIMPNKSQQVGLSHEVVHHSSDISSDSLSIEEIPPQSPGYERRHQARKDNAKTATPTPEVNEIRDAWKALGSTLAKVAEPEAGYSQEKIQTQNCRLTNTGVHDTGKSASGNQAQTAGSSKRTRPAKWTQDDDDYEDDGDVTESDGENRRKKTRLSKIWSPLSIFGPDSDESESS